MGSSYKQGMFAMSDTRLSQQQNDRRGILLRTTQDKGLSRLYVSLFGLGKVPW